MFLFQNIEILYFCIWAWKCPQPRLNPRLRLIRLLRTWPNSSTTNVYPPAKIPPSPGSRLLASSRIRDWSVSATKTETPGWVLWVTGTGWSGAGSGIPVTWLRRIAIVSTRALRSPWRDVSSRCFHVGRFRVVLCALRKVACRYKKWNKIRMI